MGLQVAVIGDLPDRDPGFVGARLEQRHGAELAMFDRDRLPDVQELADTQLLLMLGSARSVADPAQAGVVEAESAIVRDLLEQGIPVLGICYGSQLLAHALGGSVHPAPVAEIGWYGVDSRDTQLCPPGPWSQFHTDAFVPPRSARVLGTSAAGCQAFADESRPGRALAWQFHPEVTAARYAQWVTQMSSLVREHGVDPQALIDAAPGHEPRLREAAEELTDHAVHWLL